ncbi:MAG TPA: ThiF family adenylyltransferase [Phycisphaerales bacterium]|nr:ThiF family adenylyltransferase [Phycisphaerales bacterium]
MDDLARYHRQMLLPRIGEAGQQRLAASSVLLVGCGALGSVSADLLVRAGVGRLVLIDRDLVEPTNLQRQTLYTEADVGMPKAEAARRRLAAANSGVRIVAHVADFTGDAAEDLAEGPIDAVVDGTDNFETRLVLNDLAVERGVPFVYAGVVGTCGTTMTVIPGRTACLRCLVDVPPPPGALPTCDTAGVFGPTVVMAAAWQASEALRLLVGDDTPGGDLIEFDLWPPRVRRFDMRASRRADCPCCSGRRFDYLRGVAGTRTTTLCGRNSVQVLPQHNGGVDLPALAERLGAHGAIAANEFLVRCELRAEPSDGGGVCMLTVFSDGRAIVSGTLRPERARAIYARYVGS